MLDAVAFLEFIVELTVAFVRVLRRSFGWIDDGWQIQRDGRDVSCRSD